MKLREDPGSLAHICDEDPTNHGYDCYSSTIMADKLTLKTEDDPSFVEGLCSILLFDTSDGPDCFSYTVSQDASKRPTNL